MTDLTDDRLSPTVRGLVGALRRHAPDPAWPIAEHRRVFDEAADRRALAPDVSVTPVTTAGGPAEWIEPFGGLAREVVLYLHGGGFVMGSARTTRPLATHLAAAIRRRVLVLDYDSAPEHRHPHQLAQVLRCLAWLGEQGYDPRATTLAGDSAGGFLTLAALLRLRDDGAPLPGAGVLLSPLVDLGLASPTIDEFGPVDPQTPRWLLELMCGAYLGDAPVPDLLGADLRGLPDLLVQTAELEGLRGDADRLRATALAAGVRCDLATWPGMIHVWHAFAPRLPEAGAALAAVGRWLDDRG